MPFHLLLEHFFGLFFNFDDEVVLFSVVNWIKLKIFMMFSTTAQNVQTMIVGRLLAGIGIGISSAIVPLYISEVMFI